MQDDVYNGERKRYFVLKWGVSGKAACNQLKHRLRILTKMHDLFTVPEAYIPRHISNKTVLKVYDVLSRILKISPSVRKKNREINSRVLAERNIFRAGYFIENQNEWGKIRFGSGKHHNMKYSGCEIIAVYNAMLDLGRKSSLEDMAELITAFEERGAALKGEWGVAPHAIKNYLENCGYDVSAISSMDERSICELGIKSHTVIATVYNNKDNIMEGIHTVCITKKNGTYVVHNDYTRDRERTSEYRERGGYATLQEAVDSIGRAAKSIYVTGIAK